MTKGTTRHSLPAGFQLLLNCRELGAVPKLLHMFERDLLLSPPPPGVSLDLF